MKPRKQTLSVIKILTDFPECREDMMDTVRRIHLIQLNELGFRKEHYFDLLFEKKLSSIKTIDRTWSRVQKDIPELRGSEWETRQVQHKEIKVEIAKENQSLFDEIFNNNTKKENS
jgi:hypothetical protein